MSPFKGTLPLRRPRTTSQRRYIACHYVEGGRPGREVAAEMGITYGSFKRFVSGDEELKKSRRQLAA